MGDEITTRDLANATAAIGSGNQVSNTTHHHGPDRVDVALGQFDKRLAVVEEQIAAHEERLQAAEVLDSEHLETVVRARTDFFGAIYNLEEGMRRLPKRVEEIYALMIEDRTERKTRQQAQDSRIRSQGTLLYLVCGVLIVVLMAVLAMLMNVQVTFQ